MSLQPRTRRFCGESSQGCFIARWQGPISVQYRPYKVFLLFLYLRGVLFKNLNDATLSSLGNPPNMQVKVAITENTFSSISQSLYMISK